MNSSIIVTEPLPEAFWSEVGWSGAELLTDMAHSYICARHTADDRIALGGRGYPYLYGSRLDRRGHTRRQTIEELRNLLVDFFPAAGTAKVVHAWSGVLGVPRDRCSTVGLDLDTGPGLGRRLHRTRRDHHQPAGRTLRDLILSERTDLTALPWVEHRVRAWEPEPLRWLGVHSMYRLYHLADARERRLARTSTLARIADLLTGHAA